MHGEGEGASFDGAVTSGVYHERAVYVVVL